MMTNKLVIAVLVGLALLFAAGLGSNLIHKSGEKDPPADYDPSGWLADLDDVTASWFAEPLSVQRLPAWVSTRPKPKCRTALGAFAVGKAECAIEIGKKTSGSGWFSSGEERLTLEVDGNVIVQVPPPPDQSCDDADDADAGGATERSARLRPMKMVAKRPFVHFKHKDLQKKRQKILTVVYEPKDGEAADKPPTCLARKPLRLVVLEKGGTLRLTCPTCDQASVAVQFK